MKTPIETIELTATSRAGLEKEIVKYNQFGYSPLNNEVTEENGHFKITVER